MHDKRTHWPLVTRVALGACALVAAGCKGDCVDVDATNCTPLYEPTFHQIHDRTLMTSCAIGGGSCHGTSGARAGLVFDDEDTAYASLVGQPGKDGTLLVAPGDPSCSLLVLKLESADPSVQMPPGAQLGAAERCSVEQWIANGAKR